MSKILIVDDEKDILETIVDTLELEFEDIGVEFVDSGQEALTLLAEGREFCLIITDLNMPKMDGIELIEGIRGNKIKTPIIVFTGHGGEIEEEKLDQLQINAMIRKPYIDKLLYEVNQVFNPSSH